MRADRLISMLMILQTRGKVTASDLAAELEVSERTVYRDVTALSISGVPVYAERGPGGGICLVEQYRSNLTGLTREEVRALYMIGIPQPLAQLGFGPDLRGAMLKLAASLPSSLKSDEALARQRVYLDPEPWDRYRKPVTMPFLQTIQQAVWQGRVLHIRYELFAGPQIDSLDVVLVPYGLVAKGGEWYLVAQQEDHIAVLPVDRVIAAQIQDKSFQMPPDFNLESFWKQWCQGQSGYQRAFAVRMRIHPDLITKLPSQIRQAMRATGAEDDEQGRVTFEIRFGSFEEARTRLLRLGNAVEVVEPVALRYSLRDYAEQIIAVYSNQSKTG
ncbi:MAG: helix-turn-helix transcriptional regulator [Anaerolineales bacterium]|jgi:predicted DNA-binding transcriptional regulator YafY